MRPALRAASRASPNACKSSVLGCQRCPLWRFPAVGPMHRNAVWRPAGDIFLFCSVVFRLAVGCMIILLCIFFGPLVYCVRSLLRKKPPDVETIFSNAMAGEEKLLE